MFWTTPRSTEVAQGVRDFLTLAKSKGIRAHIVEIGTFDMLLSLFWRQLPHSPPPELDSRVRTAIAKPVSIRKPDPGSEFPVLRTNALVITKVPLGCGRLKHRGNLTFEEMIEKDHVHRPDAVLTYTDRLLFWGSGEDVTAMFEPSQVDGTEAHILENPIKLISESGAVKSFFEHGLARALCDGRPLVLRKRGSTIYAVVKRDEINAASLDPLKLSVGFKDKPGPIIGNVPRSTSNWAEALSLRLEEREGDLFLLVRPDIWISPLSTREDAIAFLREKRLRRYNSQAYNILDAWMKLLLGDAPTNAPHEVTCFLGGPYSATFSLLARTAYSGRPK
jgi:hypothetical protein